MLRQFKVGFGGISAIVLLAAAYASNALAESDNDQPGFVGDRSLSREAENSEDDEYNFSWLDPDKKVYVLQNRKYRKANRFALYFSLGPNLSVPYRTEWAFVPRAGYWFTEQLGIEVLYGILSNSDNDTLKALRNASPSALPFVRENRSYMGALFNWSPWYAKINVFNKILYFDWLFNTGAGQLTTRVDQNTRADQPPNFKTETHFAWFFGTGHKFYVTKDVLFRWDLIGMLYSATSADNRTKQTKSNFDFTVGLGYAF
ncbi:MAG: outer membrane beta-barrel domain-containing protein [Bdellovibrionota bacterium]